MRSLMACGLAVVLILISAKLSPALAIMAAVVADGLGFDGGWVLTFLWN